MKQAPFKTGIEALLDGHASLLRGHNLGLVSHAAAVDTTGRSTIQILIESGFKVIALYSPEHGFFGQAPAGQSVPSMRHPTWNIPILSMYGHHKKPSMSSLRRIEVLLVDLQDLGVRTYTYVSTLVSTLDAAAASGVRVIVTDRPIPFGTTVDGPMLEPAFRSFVGAVETPLVYGMTPAETAMWLKKIRFENVDLIPAPMQGWSRSRFPGDPLRPWVPPSPGIRSRESALCYPATVFGEAIPAIDIGRGTLLPFQLFGAPWARSKNIVELLETLSLPGVFFAPHPYWAAMGRHANRLLDGVRMVVTDPASYRPALTAVAIAYVMQKIRGMTKFWRDPHLRHEFFDKLMGTNQVRLALMEEQSPHTIAEQWQKLLEQFLQQRRNALLYK